METTRSLSPEEHRWTRSQATSTPLSPSNLGHLRLVRFPLILAAVLRVDVFDTFFPLNFCNIRHAFKFLFASFKQHVHPIMISVISLSQQVLGDDSLNVCE